MLWIRPESDWKQFSLPRNPLPYVPINLGRAAYNITKCYSTFFLISQGVGGLTVSER